MALEVLTGHCTQQADLWSAGVFAFMLLASQVHEQIVEQIIAGEYNLNGRRWKQISSQVKDVVKNLLVVDPYERLTVDEALSSCWLNRG
jgi:phosphorylase kinase gamma subunit